MAAHFQHHSNFQPAGWRKYSKSTYAKGWENVELYPTKCIKNVCFMERQKHVLIVQLENKHLFFVYSFDLFIFYLFILHLTLT